MALGNEETGSDTKGETPKEPEKGSLQGWARRNRNLLYMTVGVLIGFTAGYVRGELETHRQYRDRRGGGCL